MVALDKDRGHLSKLSAHFLPSLKVNLRQFGRWEMEEFDCWIQILALRGQHLNVGHPTTSYVSSKGFDGVFGKNHARGQRLRHTKMSHLIY